MRLPSSRVPAISGYVFGMIGVPYRFRTGVAGVRERRQIAGLLATSPRNTNSRSAFWSSSKTSIVSQSSTPGATKSTPRPDRIGALFGKHSTRHRPRTGERRAARRRPASALLRRKESYRAAVRFRERNRSRAGPPAIGMLKSSQASGLSNCRRARSGYPRG